MQLRIAPVPTDAERRAIEAALARDFGTDSLAAPCVYRHGRQRAGRGSELLGRLTYADRSEVPQ